MRDLYALDPDGVHRDMWVLSDLDPGSVGQSVRFLRNQAVRYDKNEQRLRAVSSGSGRMEMRGDYAREYTRVLKELPAGPRRLAIAYAEGAKVLDDYAAVLARTHAEVHAAATTAQLADTGYRGALAAFCSLVPVTLSGTGVWRGLNQQSARTLSAGLPPPVPDYAVKLGSQAEQAETTRRNAQRQALFATACHRAAALLCAAALDSAADFAGGPGGDIGRGGRPGGQRHFLLSAPTLSDPGQSRDGRARGDFRVLRRWARKLRAQGVASVREMDGNSVKDSRRRPRERAITTARYRRGEFEKVVKVYNFSGQKHDWTPADRAPDRPDKGRLFETSPAPSYDPKARDWSVDGDRDRTHDAEAKLFEDLARLHLREYSGLSASEVDQALEKAARQVKSLDSVDGKFYEPNLRGQLQRTQDRLDLAISELNKRASKKAEGKGGSYSPFVAEDISGDLRMIVDLPSAKLDGVPPEFQVCLSCQKVMIAYESAFPGVRLEVVNLDGERLYPP
ncbi:hypothetical protein GCM10022243_67200 [Saccharothrix violaceirubra]|uniref:Uncharacterized protein n=1 Tax=Saccharothrix violaceirubra TaxID=413306 RepID=A0A7W7WVH0_9PSEU|nr:hypothetical protein [Saccharothrix violaceirubra]MBB4965329.1 hypothetical protein [Saccharothrix violaceirubra]